MDVFNKYYKEGILAKDFMLRCLEKKPNKRPTAEQLLEHPWIKHFAHFSELIIDEDDRVDIYVNLYTFKRSSLIQ